MLEKIINYGKKVITAGGLLLLFGCSLDEDIIVESGSTGTIESTLEYPDMPTYSREETNKNKNMDESVNIGSWWHDDYSKSEFRKTLMKMHDMGVENVNIIVTQYVLGFDDTTIESINLQTPSDDALKTAIGRAKQLGLKVTLKPHVDSKLITWRGYIKYNNETDWQEWWDSYDDFISHYAQLAEENGVDALIIGTELKGTSHRSEWADKIIPSVRSKFSGEITYAANWDNFKNITFWGDLDYIGIDAYFPLTNSNDPTPAELSAAYEVIAADIEAFAATYGKDVVFTEFGCQSTDGANITPWDCDGALDETEQAEVYAAFLGEFHNKSGYKGIAMWQQFNRLDNYNSNTGSFEYLDPDNFGFLGKLVEFVLGNFYRLDG